MPGHEDLIQAGIILFLLGAAVLGFYVYLLREAILRRRERRERGDKWAGEHPRTLILRKTIVKPGKHTLYIDDKLTRRTVKK